MNLFAWIVFGIINAVLLNALEPTDGKREYGSLLLGMLGAITGGLFAYAIFGGASLGINISLLSIILLEAGLLFLLFFGKSFKRMT